MEEARREAPDEHAPLPGSPSLSPARPMSVLLKCLAPRPMATQRLLCVPYAGGGAAMFRGWAALLPASVEAFAVQLPGREDRLREAPYETWSSMMAALIESLDRLPALPSALFGHSLGAVMALEMARWLHARRPAQLLHLFVSGRPWPGGGEHLRGDLAALPDAQLLEALDRQYGSLSAALSNPDIRALALPILRADLRLLASYRYLPAAPLACPLTVFAGVADPATPPASLAGWQRETNAPFAIQMLEGQHFFLESQCVQLVADVVSRLP